MGISIRAYARHRGVTDTAVHKAIRAGRITPEADGSKERVHHTPESSARFSADSFMRVS